VNGVKNGPASENPSATAARPADGAKLSLGNPRRKIEGFGATVTLKGNMKPIVPLERDLSKLASVNWTGPDFDSFRSGVWREIRHRRAVESLSTSASFWRWGLLDFGAGRLALAAACVAACVGVALGIWATPDLNNSRVAARNLDLGVFSNAALGLPSNFLASRK
jgi:hypothetical protein